MPRPPSTAQYNADDATIQLHFDEAMELHEQQREGRSELSAHTKAMFADGIDPGIMSICRRLALLKEGKRGISVALLHRYLMVLASRLDDPTVVATKNGEARHEAPAVPFKQQDAAA